MILARIDVNAGSIDSVDQAILFVDPARPQPVHVTPQGFRLAKTVEGVALGILDQRIEAFEFLSVVSLPVKVLVPGMDS